MFERAERGDRAVILHPVFKLTGPEALDEFQELARSAGAEVVGIVTAPRDRPDARFFVGSGKIEELEDLVRETGADLVLVSQSLSAVQERNIEKVVKARVLRDGQLTEIPAEELVPGDLVSVEVGDLITADGRVRVEFIDPQEHPQLEQEANEKYGIKPVPFQFASKYQASVVNSYFNILIQYGDQYQILDFR